MIVWQSNVNAQASGQNFHVRRQQLLNNYISVTTEAVIPEVVPPSPGGGRLGRAARPFVFRPVPRKRERKKLTIKTAKRETPPVGSIRATLEGLSTLKGERSLLGFDESQDQQVIKILEKLSDERKLLRFLEQEQENNEIINMLLLLLIE